MSTKAKGYRPFVKTRHPGIFKRGSRYYHVWRPPGEKQRRDSYSSLAEALEAKARVVGGDTRVTPKTKFGDYAERWKVNYRGRTSHGFSENTRAEYARDIDRRAMPYFGNRPLGDIRRSDVRPMVRVARGPGRISGWRSQGKSGA